MNSTKYIYVLKYIYVFCPLFTSHNFLLYMQTSQHFHPHRKQNKTSVSTTQHKLAFFPQIMPAVWNFFAIWRSQMEKKCHGYLMKQICRHSNASVYRGPLHHWCMPLGEILKNILSVNNLFQCHMFSKFCLLTFKKYKGTHLHVKTGPCFLYMYSIIEVKSKISHFAQLLAKDHFLKDTS